MIVRIDPAHVFASRYGLSQTTARRAFKTNAGQNNHFVITLLVGLDAVRSGVATVSEEFSTTWRPHDPHSSAARSREYALKSSLAWIIDLVDVYRRSITNISSLITSPQRHQIEMMENHAKRVRQLAKTLEIELADPNLLMVLLAFAWRNRVVHSDAETKVDPHVKARLLEQADEIAQRYRGLDIRRAIAACENSAAPSFKEVAGIIRASQTLIETIDDSAMSKIDYDSYVESLLYEHFTDQFKLDRQVFAKMWPGSQEKTAQRLSALLRQKGMTSVEPEANGTNVDYFLQLTQLRPSEARRRFTAGE